MRSRQLESSLAAFAAEAARHLSGETAGGAEVGFEVVAAPSRRRATPLYCYRPLTGRFLREHARGLARLPSYGPALAALEGFEHLDRYLLVRGAPADGVGAHGRAATALVALLEDVFEEQTIFELRPERLTGALGRLEKSAIPAGGEIIVVGTLAGLALGSAELALTRGLALARPDALHEAPEEAVAVGVNGPPHLLVTISIEGSDLRAAVEAARGVLRDLLRALRLFGDGRVTLGEMAWSRVVGGSWRPLAMGQGGRARGMLVITPAQEDELRGFCNLISRRAPYANEVGWALRRFEMGCQRANDHEALTDYLLGLRALLEPEGPTSGLLPGRLAALCATPERRLALAQRVVHAQELERSVIMGGAGRPGPDALVQAIGDHLRALLRDVICGHLDPQLDRVADELIDEALTEPAQSHTAGLVAAGTTRDERWAPAAPVGLSL